MNVLNLTLYMCLYVTEGAYTPPQEGQFGLLLKLLKVPTVIIVCLAIFVASIASIILDPTLEPHLEQVSAISSSFHNNKPKI